MNVEQLYRDIGVILELAGDRWKASCPFHVEKTPSFVVYPDGSFYCFGCCEGGSYFVCRKKLGFNVDPNDCFIPKRLEDIEENSLFDLTEKKIEMEEKLLVLLDEKEYNIKKQVWNMFDLIWMDKNFLPNGMQLIDLSLFLQKRFKEIEAFIK